LANQVAIELNITGLLKAPSVRSFFVAYNDSQYLFSDFFAFHAIIFIKLKKYSEGIINQWLFVGTTALKVVSKITLQKTSYV